MIDAGTSVSLRRLDSADAAAEASRAGLRRLFMLQLEKEIEYISRHIPNLDQMCLNYATVGGREELRRDLLSAIVDRAAERGEIPRGADAAGFMNALAAPLYYRLLVTREPVTEQDADRAAAAALAAARAGVFTTDG